MKWAQKALDLNIVVAGGELHFPSGLHHSQLSTEFLDLAWDTDFVALAFVAALSGEAVERGIEQDQRLVTR